MKNIAILIPVHNHLSHTKKCIRALEGLVRMERPVHSNYHIVVVDDGSTDGTFERVKGLDDSRIRLFRIERSYRYPPTARNHWLAGPVMALNESLKHVMGEWIARIDDDDIWTDDHLESLLVCAKLTGAEFVSASYIEERMGVRTVMDHIDIMPRIGGIGTWLYKAYLRFFQYNINCWRKSWNAVNDTDIADRMYKAGVNMVYLDKVITYILPRPGEKTIGLDAYLERDKDEAV